MPRLSKLEIDIQENVTAEAVKLSLIPLRINVKGRKGWPDYGYLYMGRACLVEFKRPGEQPEPLQKYVHNILNVAQIPTFVVDNESYGVTLLKEWKNGVDLELARLRQSNHFNE